MYYHDEAKTLIYIFDDAFPKVISINYYNYKISFLAKIGGDAQKLGLEKVSKFGFFHYVNKKSLFASLFS
jgi:hypothetical protein